MRRTSYRNEDSPNAFLREAGVGGRGDYPVGMLGQDSAEVRLPGVKGR